ncbi:MAG TPA: non-ribosomal peptide synthase/polyketide synthase, partial [Candidatus Angelobacter sp.]|nr:non-ribosomal peptide synthase/polyketide synthase [Candidatus Angelobacter sp.]
EGRPVQKIAAERELAVDERDLRDLPSSERYDEAKRLVEAMARVPFDLSRSPLVRVTLLQLSEQDHILLVVMHHIVSDGWSIGVMVREFSQLYEAYAKGEESPLDQSRIQYLDYTIWQHKWLHGEVLEEQLRYWRDQLADLPVMEYPSDYSRPHSGEQPCATITWKLPEKLSSDLSELSRRESVTMFMTLLAAFQVLLSRYCGQSDIAIGTPIAGRRSVETEALIGFFINTLVLRTRIDPAVSFPDLLAQVRAATLAAYEHQDVPFEKLVEELRPQRDLGRAPFFQTMFIFQNAPQGAVELPGLKLSEIEIESAVTKFDLKLTAMETNNIVRGRLEYRADLFHGRSMGRMLEHWEKLLAEIVRYPQEAVGRLSMLTESEKRQILRAWNDPGLESPHSNVFDAFDEQALRTPNAIAVEHGSQRLTYQEFRRQTDAIEASLIKAGAKTGDLVLIFSEERLKLIASMVGILKAGCGFVPMLPSLPDQRIAAMLAQCRPVWAIVDAGLGSRFEQLKHDSGQQVHEVVITDHSGAEQPRPSRSRSGDELSYIFFTSGSTGTPKAIAGRLKGINHFIHWQIQEFGIGSESRVAQLTSPMFDPLLRDVFVPLCSGGTLCIPSDPDLVLSGAELGQWLEQERITLMHTVPSIFRLMVSQCRGRNFASLKNVLLAGEVVLPTDISNWHALVGPQGARLINLYGPSETTMVKFLYAVNEGDQWRRSVPIGKPIGGATAIVLDESGNICPTGIAGEIYIRTPYRSLGYYQQPELTGRVFVPNPLGNDQQDIVYRTGDLARLLEDGNFALVGRRDHQVKVRGVRIELGEIEAALGECEGVGSAVVVARESDQGEKKLAGYVVARDGAAIDSRDLRAALKKRLPDAMIPAVFVVLKEMPLTSNGKVDRMALPEPELSQGGQDYVAPRTAEEEILCGIWAETLKLRQVGIEDNFFEIGGHSLLVTQVIARIRGMFGVELPLRTLFEHPTVERIAHELRHARSAGRKAAPKPLPRSGRGIELPLSFAQQRLWFLEQMDPGNAVYNIPFALRMKGELHHAALQKSLESIVERHEALRTVFVLNSEREAVQRVRPVADACLQVAILDIGHLPPEQREAEARRLAEEETKQGFDLSSGPLLRVKLMRMAEQEHVLLLTMHHIVSDGWSMGLLVREFMELYDAALQQRPSTLEKLEIQYGDYALWQREWLQGEVLEEQLNYWKQQLAGLESLQLPTDRPRPATVSHRGGAINFQLGEELTESLRALSRQTGATLFMTLLGGLQVLLGRYARQDDIAVGMPVANRTHSELEKLIGFFVNTLVLRCDVMRGRTVQDQLRLVRETALAAYAHQDLPFEKLVEELQPARHLNREPLIQVMFSLQDVSAVQLQVEGLSFEAIETEKHTAKFDLTWSVAVNGPEVMGRVEYDSDLFERWRIEAMVRHWTRLLRSMTQDAGQTLGQLTWLSDIEREQLIVGWNQAESTPVRDKTIVELFEEQIKQAPEAWAVAYESRLISYGELNRRTNQLAHYLRSLGVGPEVRVALCLERSLEVIVGVLAVLKAGGAYVPLDPSYPAERLTYMLEDTRAAVMLTQHSMRSIVSDFPIKRICLDSEWETIADFPANDPKPLNDPDHAAYVIYTSGSTGKPKGTIAVHRGITRLVKSPNYASFGPDDVLLLFAPLTFDASTLEIWASLLNGALLAVFPAGKASLRELGQFIAEQKVSTVWLTSGLFTQMVEHELESLRSVRQFLTGGDVISPTHVAKFCNELEHCTFISCYGPTEATTFTTCYRMNGVRHVERSVPIGAPVPSTQVYVLDEEMEPVPVGIAGELYVGGDGLARGYLNLPEQTAERFVPNPFAIHGGAEFLRLYRTGDLVCWRPDGNLEFLGRLDQQVKIRGFRIEPGEIESVLREHAEVGQARVITRQDDGEDKRLVAYVVGKQPEAKINVNELRQLLKEKLPEYMAPSAYVQLEELPLTLNGKLDRKRLPRPEAAVTQGERRYLAPRNAEEEILCGVLAQVLKLDRVGVEEDFFELGGHSLLATQVISRVREAFAVDLPLRALFEHPTVVELAHELRRSRTQAEQQPGWALVHVREREELPLSFAQERLWFIDQLEPGSATYNVPVGYLLKGILNKEALRQGLNEIVNRHEVLRTAFPTRDGKPVQKIAAEMPLVITKVDLSEFSAEKRLQEAYAQAKKEAETPFDLAQGPLVRVKLVRLSCDEHVLLATMHHIVSDGWSMIILQREFSQLYQAYATGGFSPLAEMPIQYADYALWQRNWLQGQVLEEQLGYWRNQLAEATPLELATDKPRPGVLSEAGADIIVEIGQEQSGELCRLARRENATVFMVLLAALDTLLWRYSGQKDIAVGTGIANRNRMETEGLIGFFVNTLVLRSNVQGRSSAQEFLSRVRHTTLEAYRYQDVPFEKVVEDLQPERDLGHTPLFQVALVLQNFSTQPFSLPALEVHSFEAAQSAAKTELRFLLEDTGEGLKGRITYAVDLYEPETIVRMAAHWKQLLTEFVAHLDRPVADLSMMGAVEQRQILGQWSVNDDLQAWTGSVATLFAQQAARTPDAPAVIWPEGRLIYRDMASRVWQMGRFLRELGVGPETRVGICLDPGADLIVAFFAVIAAGATYVPLDPDYPAERLGYMLEDAQPAVVLTETRLQDRPPDNRAKLVCLDRESEAIAAHSTASLEVDVSPDNLLYVIFTSGSTGRPKGVAVSQGAMVSRALFLSRCYQSRENDRSLQILSPSFDAFGGGLYSTLFTGGAIVFARPEQMLEPAQLCTAMEQTQVTTLRIPVGYLCELLSYALQNRLVLPASLRLIITGGETISRTEMRDWLKQAAPRARFIHEYGPTETTITATLHEDDLNAGTLANSHRFLIGQPNGNTRVYVLGEEMEAVATGVTGELYIGGSGLARCYTGPAGQTAEKFVPDPFSRTGERLYRTGDWGRWLADGTLEFLGRRDDQVKLRGYRIELGEIEAALRRHEAISNVAVIVREDKLQGKRLVAYVVAKEGPAPAAAELRSFLKEKLPEYMVPSVFVEMAELPFMAGGGKLDRKRLPEPSEDEETGQAPRTPTEEILCGIWGDVLKRERIGINQNFFALGGHSLLATQVISRVRQVFGLELPLRALFEAQTVAGLAARIEQEKQAANVASLPPLRRVPRGVPLLLSYAQQRLWFLDQLEPNSAAYNIPVALRLKGELRTEPLDRALQEIVRRHEVLRTRFEPVDGEPRQVIAPASDVYIARLIEKHDLSAFSADDQRAEVQRQVREEAALPFDLANGPLLRAKLFRLSSTEHVLLVTMHHIVSDGWSMGVLIREFAALYQAYEAGQTPSLPEMTFQYADYAMWQREWLQGAVLDEQLAYWKKQLEDVPVLELPADYPRTIAESEQGARLNLVLPAELTQKLRELSQREGATLFMTMLASFQLLLSRYTGQSDVAVGTPIAGRRWAETEDLIGFFVNTLVLRTQVSGDQSFREVLAQVREKTLEAYAHQDVPFEKLVEELHPERDLARTPLFQVMFVLQNAPQTELQIPGLTLSSMNIESNGAKFDLMLMTGEEHGRLHTGLSYRSGWFSENSMRRMLSHWEMLLTGIVANPQMPVKNLPMLAEAERQQVVHEWNLTAAQYPEQCVHEMVEQQAAKTPEAFAVEFGSFQLTYAELNRQANRLARYLTQNGAGPEIRVGLCMERSPEQMVGLLGILKAGAAYVPLDPRHPSARLAYQIEDSQIEVLVTQEQFTNLFSSLVKTIVCLDSMATKVVMLDGSNLKRGVDADNLAYVIYTSGSTGKPKGVGMTHGPLTNLIHWQILRSSVDHPLRTLQFTSLTFDVSFQEILATWCQGGCLVLMGEDARQDFSLLWRILREKRIERLFLPFVALDQLAEAANLSDYDSVDLREVITAGEQLKITPAVLRLFNSLPECILDNQYGPTESHVITAHGLDGRASGWTTLPPIGRPIANTQVYVLDEALEPVPARVAGELFLGGVALARGYVGRPELTAEKFVPDPFSPKAGSRLYRTGDLARYLPDGQLEFLGRKDHQVKIRGFRIELGEIETALSECAGVAQAAVVVRESRPGEKRLVAYVVVKPGQTVSNTSLRAGLREKLPEYMVPASFVEIREFPLTSSGKVDRKRLPEPVENLTAGAYNAPQGIEEELLCGIWEEVLKKERIGRDDNFFEMGGHSLLATQLITRTRKAFEVDLPVRSLFEKPTVAGLGEIIRQMKQGESAATSVLPLITRADREGYLPLSSSQQRLWFLDQLDSGQRAYNLPAVLRLRGELRLDVLRVVLEEIVRRHEALRTSFPAIDGTPYQSISPTSYSPLELVDLTELPSQESEAHARKLVFEEAQRSFNLASGPLLHSVLYKLQENEHILCFTVHHIIFDGWSVPILLREMTLLYEAFLHGRPSPLPDLPLQYADFAVWERDYLQGEVLNHHLDYWRTRLEGCSQRLELPTDFQRPPVQSFRGGTHRIQLSPELSRSLKNLGLEQGATMYMTLLALINIWLSHYSRQRDILVGTPASNRNQVEMEAVIGFFVNTLVFRNQIELEARFIDLLAQIRSNVLEGQAHQALPFEMLVDALHIERDPGRNPLFQMMFNMESTSDAKLEIPGVVEMEPIRSGFVQSRFDLYMVAIPRVTGLELVCNYSADLFRLKTIEMMVALLAELIRAALETPQARISELMGKLVQFEQRQALERGKEKSQRQTAGLHAIQRRAVSGISK